MTHKRIDQLETMFHFQRFFKRLMLGVSILLIVGCSVKLVDETVSPTPQSLDNSYLIKLKTAPDPYVLSVDTPQILIDGTWHAMQEGTGLNEWNHVRTVSPSESEIQYRYKVDYVFNASLIPGIYLFTNQGRTFSPSSEDFHSLAIDQGTKIPGDELLQVPLRWCAVQGSSAVEAPDAVGETSTDDVLKSRHVRASDNIWIPGARISFRSAMIAQDGYQANFPVIPDPNPPPLGPGEEGDIVIITTAYAPEVNEVVANCEAAWDQLEQDVGSNIEGVIVVNIRNFVVPSGGVTSYQGLQFFGINLHCSEFDSLSQDICQNPLNYPSNTGAAVVIRDNVTRLQWEPDENTLAHELGHALFLGHGNGQDDDGDGKVDLCCDRDEDPEALPDSLMCPSCTSDLITSHQRDFSRQVALQTPGAVIDPPALLKPVNVFSDQRVDARHDTKQPGLDFVWTGMSENLKTGKSLFTHKLFGLIPKKANYRYILFVDLDNDEATGLSPNDIGYTTSLKGISLIIDATVKGSIKDTETVLYVANNDKWLNKSDNAYSFISTAVEAETGTRLFNAVNTIISTKIIGQAGHRVAIRSESHNWNRGLADVLPDNAKSTILIIKPPEYPVCSVEPPQAKAGETVMVKAFDLWPNETAHVLLGDEQIAEAKIGAKGIAEIEFRIPENARNGVRLITVGLGKTAITADCAVEVVGDDTIMGELHTKPVHLRDKGQ